MLAGRLTVSVLRLGVCPPRLVHTEWLFLPVSVCSSVPAITVLDNE